jgi:hypothetical protein
LTAALDRAEQILAGGTSDGGRTSGQLDTFATELERDSGETMGRDQVRLRALAETVKRIANSLR